MANTHSHTHGEINFSRLEASLATTNVIRRQNSVEMRDVNRHGVADDAHINELDFDFSTASSCEALRGLHFLQDVFPAVQYHQHMQNLLNFSDQTQIQCFEADGTHQRWHDISADGLENILHTRFESDESGGFVACDFFCQHPRWNLSFQGAPLSVYVRYTKVWNLTTYIIAHRERDANVNALQSILGLAGDVSPNLRVFFDDPFDIAVLLSTLSFETSKFHVKKFQRFMWTQINKVDDHLAGIEGSDRARLGDLTKQLQVISQNADSHIANADVAIVTADAIRTAHTRLRVAISSPASSHQRVHDAIEYVIKSMEKQKLWFLNYKGRKDSTMSLVYNLVTQQDAANNIQLSVSMKKDSTSMNAIAALTMVFLPGTFVASILDAGVFTSEPGSNKIQTSGIWWVWLAISVPLTITTVLCW
ncbi:hypothetical protein K504DRAFT_372085 [Pleomassaria siparia CBS 279.74]|uniref:Cora-domain-containing protein n=1 Tax=Pleomassaria siparia CBS 279.74 TaxID=1314801 RepID=A0A6G1KHT8_9PLEO|nr:hypothetical protein K504DRAFT_372085 [Pleomassaria siparia CBS 279.74]